MITKPRKLRHNGGMSLIHTREDISVLIRAHNELCDCVEKLIRENEEMKKQIEELKEE